MNNPQNDIAEDTSEFLNPKEFAQNLYDKGEFFVIVWDSNKFRMSQRVSELMLLGYAAYGELFTHDVVVNKQLHKSQVCLAMVNKTLFQEAQSVAKEG